MQLKTILNRVEPYKSFVYSKVQMFETGGTPHIEITIEPRVNGRPICSGCLRPAPGYDRQPRPRRFEYVPLWAISVCFLYRMRRVSCPTCGIKTEEVPWCLLKRPENLTDKQTVKLRELTKHNLRSLRARLLREDFQRFWEYSSPGWAAKFLDEWCHQKSIWISHARSRANRLISHTRRPP